MPRVKKEDLTEKKAKKRAKPIQVVKGMKDILPPEQYVWEHILSNAQKMCQDFGFGRIETPVMEFTELFRRGVGSSTDIVEKEMFSFETQGGDQVSLRPEGTAGVVRSYVENGMSKWSQPVRVYYEGPMFRYDKPQQGRYRQFTQFGAEVLGEDSSAIDAQIIYLAWKIFQKIGISNVSIQINSIGCANCRTKYKKLLTDYYDMKLNKLCVDCKRRLEKNPMRLLDCKEEKCMQVAAGGSADNRQPLSGPATIISRACWNTWTSWRFLMCSTRAWCADWIITPRPCSRSGSRARRRNHARRLWAEAADMTGW